MNLPTGDIDRSIQRLLARIEEYEQKAASLKSAVNVLCEEAGQPALFPEGNAGGSRTGQGASILSKIKDDTFYGRKQQTAIREYLEMRKAQGLGPAKPREIFDALKAGGYQFETKDDGVGLVSMRALLRKRTHIFHKLPNGSYGMTAWYPDAKAAKIAAADGDDDTPPAETKTATGKKPTAA